MKKMTSRLFGFRFPILGLVLTAAFFGFSNNVALAWNLQGSCSVAPASPNIGETVTWTATQTSTMTPSQGHYEYSWSGTDGLAGISNPVSKSYATTGTKNATVVIMLVLNAGGREKITRNCFTVVKTSPPLPGQCKLEMTKEVDKATATVGDVLTYTLTFKNSGDADCTGGGVRIQDVVDSALTYQSETRSGNVDVGYNSIPLYSASTRTLNWNGNVLTPGESGSISWKGKVNEPAACGVFDIPNKARITSAEYSPADLMTTPSVWVESNTVKTTITKDCPLPLELSVTCTANPSAVQTGDAVTWSSTASGGVGSYTYSWTGDDGFSSTDQTDSKSYTSSGTKNATVTVTSSSETISKTCTTSVASPTSSPSPLSGSCAVSPTAVEIGQEVTWSASATGGTGSYTYSWSGTDGLTGSDASVSRSYASSGTKMGNVTITSGSESITSNACSVDIKPSSTCTSNCGGGGGVGGGGGYNPPTVVLLKKAEKLPLAFVYLSQIPYTGFGDSFKVIAFILGLIIWSILVVYLFKSGIILRVIERIQKRLKREEPNLVKEETQVPIDENSLITESPDYQKYMEEDSTTTYKHSNQSYAYAGISANPSFIPDNLPGEDISLEPTVVDERNIREALLAKARERKTLISEDAVKLLLQSLSGNYAKAETALTKVIDDAETKYVKEDGWILLNREKMALLLPTPHFSVNSSKTTPPAPNGMFVPTALERESYALPRFSDKAPVAKVENTTAPVPAPVSYAQTSNHSNSAPVFLSTLSFIRAIVAKDSQKVFAVLRTLRQEGKNVEDFIKSVIYELDEAYRGRLEEGIRGGNVELKTVVSAWTNDDLEEVITIFLTIIDQSYKNSLTGLKLAIMRILDLKKRG